MTDYEDLLDTYDALSGHYKGWTLGEIRGLTPRERLAWIDRAQRRIARGNQT